MGNDFVSNVHNVRGAAFGRGLWALRPSWEVQAG